MGSPLFGEFMGTLVLVLLGNGVLSNVLLRRTKAEAAGWMVIASGWAFAVLAGIFTALACGSPDANINPAVTLAFAISSGSFSKVLPFAAAQLFGAFAGATLVWIYYFPHWGLTENAETKLACFSTVPPIRKLWSNLISEIIGTFLLVFIAAAIFSRAVAMIGPVGEFAPYLIACLVWGIGLSLGGMAGFAINPARDLGPRIAHALIPISGKGRSDWGYALVPLIGPLIGSSLGGLLIRHLKL